MTSSTIFYSLLISVDTRLLMLRLGSVSLATITTVTLWITGLLCLLNIGFAVFYRKRQKKEVASYLAACMIEMIVFVFALLFQLRVITHVPYHLPPGLPVNRAEIGAALAFGIGLFPAAYWHRINISELPRRIADDGQMIKNRDAGVRIRDSAPGEWMN